ncbi:MAG: cysteine--tRNA ligase [bacterium]|nr:cysteine--tRNA ligase [bacterium]
MKIKIFNTLSQKLEFLPSKKEINLFVCGPTVYDLSHLGHARTYIFFDFFVKFLKKQGYKVNYIQNITDVDDKIINRAKIENKNPLDISKYFTKLYLKDMKDLEINSVSIYAPATKFISQIVKQVEILIQKGYAYQIDDGYYFNIKKFKNYGKLSRRTIEQAEDALSRIDDSIKKINRGDFCLWKFPSQEKKEQLNSLFKNKKFAVLDYEPFWNTKIGWGRPGWHIEDTAIAMYYFGNQYDIHGGGIDLKFPHHEAEIAQAESISSKKPYVKIWMHTGQLMINNQKMSKSLNNFITINDFLKQYKPIVLRFLVLMHDWSSPLNYSSKTIQTALGGLQLIFETQKKLELIIKNKKFGKIKISIQKQINNFNKALNNNLKTPEALSYIFEIIKIINTNLLKINKQSAKLIKKQLQNALSVLSLNIIEPKIPLKIKALIDKREKLRINKQFMQADALRNKIFELGYIIEDSPVGPIVYYKNLWTQK